MGRNEVFWEYEIKKNSTEGYMIVLYPIEESGVSVDSYYLKLKYKNSELLWGSYELKEFLETKLREAIVDEAVYEQLRDDISENEGNKVIIRIGALKDPKSLESTIKTVLSSLTEMILQEMEVIDKIQEELKDIATPKES